MPSIKPSSNPKWPDYPVGPRESVFALGVIALGYNRLEIAFRSLFSAVTNIPTIQTRILFPKLSNHARRDVLDQMLAERNDIDAQVARRIEHFARAFMICAENRHGVMHAHSTGFGILNQAFGKDDDPATLAKFTKSGGVQELTATVMELRRVADEMQLYTNFGLSLTANIPTSFVLPHVGPRRDSHRAWPLPDMPPLPFALDFRAPAPLDKP